MTSKRKVLLWTAPRCTSTAFYRAMYNRPNTKCSNEQYALPYYWGKTRISQRYKTEHINESYTYQNITKQMEEQSNGWDYFDSSEAGFKEIYDLYHQVTGNLGQQTVVIDGDDIIKNPEKMLKAFCQKIDITYHDSMVNWKDDPLSMGITSDWGSGWFQPLFSTSKFEPRFISSEKKQEDLPEVFQKCIKENIKYYEELYKLRLQS